MRVGSAPSPEALRPPPSLPSIADCARFEKRALFFACSPVNTRVMSTDLDAYASLFFGLVENAYFLGNWKNCAKACLFLKAKFAYFVKRHAKY